MKSICLTGGLLLIALAACPLFAEECPAWGENKALLQFLRDHKSNGKAADPACISRAFSSLGHDKTYLKALVELLDFERNNEDDDSLRFPSSRYPAIGALDSYDAVPYLLKAIKDSDSELVRQNAFYALDLVYKDCPLTLVTVLRNEAAKPENTVDQKARLQAAATFADEHRGTRPCRSDSSAQ